MARTRPTLRPSELKRLSDLKRKASTDPPQEPPSKLPRRGDTTTFPFLSLPRELRDEIYRYVLLGRSASLSTSKSQALTINSPLTSVNPQICEEFHDALFFHAQVITTNVRNYNFSHVVTFLNRLSEAQLARLKSKSTDESQAANSPSNRTVRITLSFTPAAKNCRTNLNRWLDRFDVEEKRGKEISFEYDADIKPRDGSYKNRPYHRTMASARWTEEARKIERAQQVWREWAGWEWKSGRGAY